MDCKVCGASKVVCAKCATRREEKLTTEIARLRAELDAAKRERDAWRAATGLSTLTPEQAGDEIDRRDDRLAAAEGLLREVKDDIGGAEWGSHEHGVELLAELINKHYGLIDAFLAGSSAPSRLATAEGLVRELLARNPLPCKGAYTDEQTSDHTQCLPSNLCDACALRVRVEAFLAGSPAPSRPDASDKLDEALAYTDKLASRNRTLAEHLAKRVVAIDGLCFAVARLHGRINDASAIIRELAWALAHSRDVVHKLTDQFTDRTPQYVVNCVTESNAALARAAEWRKEQEAPR